MVAAHLKTVMAEDGADVKRVAPGVVTPLPPKGVAVKKPVAHT